MVKIKFGCLKISWPPRIQKYFHAQLSMKFILLINVMSLIYDVEPIVWLHKLWLHKLVCVFFWKETRLEGNPQIGSLAMGLIL